MPLTPSPVPLLGRRYDVVRRLGVGGFAVLVLAEVRALTGTVMLAVSCLLRLHCPSSSPGVQDTMHPRRRPVAIKVMRAGAMYTKMGELEVERLRQLQARDPGG